MWLSEQIQTIRERDPAARSSFEILLTYPSFPQNSVFGFLCDDNILKSKGGLVMIEARKTFA